MRRGHKKYQTMRNFYEPSRLHATGKVASSALGSLAAFHLFHTHTHNETDILAIRLTAASPGPQELQ